MHTNGTKTIPYDGSQFLADPVDQADALNDALDSGSAAVVAIALRDIAKARGMTEVAKKVGITRAGLYKALSQGEPQAQGRLPNHKDWTTAGHSFQRCRRQAEKDLYRKAQCIDQGIR